MSEPLAKKIRSCSSSESTPNHLGLDEATGQTATEGSATLLDAVRRYEAEAARRAGDAAAVVAGAKDDVLAAMEALKRAHEKLGRSEASAAEAITSAQAAREYRAKWELTLTGKAAPGTSTTASAAQVSASDHDEEAKHVSFAVPRHASLADPQAVGSGAASTKRIRVSEHGWGMYAGALDCRGEPHGRGVTSWDDGGRYDGVWVDGKANGTGTMDYGNGDRYEGEWQGGRRCGVGTHHFKDGGVYEGQWRNAAPDGHGKMTLKNGSHYEGSWRDGKWHGRGIVRPVNGGEWEGTFHRGQCTVGTLRRPNGELEVGRYDSVNPDDVKEGVWWSVDRQHVYIVEGGQKKERIDQDRAQQLVAQLGLLLPEELGPLPIPAAAAAPIKSEE